VAGGDRHIKQAPDGACRCESQHVDCKKGAQADVRRSTHSVVVCKAPALNNAP
jgi:hypothetical protein